MLKILIPIEGRSNSLGPNVIPRGKGGRPPSI
jgi:hypothetical protein